MSKSYSKTRILVECALMIAVGTVLSSIKFFTLPNGGSVTLLSMLPFVLVSFRHGAKWGLFTGFVNSCLQMIMGFYPPPASTFLYFLGEVLAGLCAGLYGTGSGRAVRPPLQEPHCGRSRGHLCRRLSALYVQLFVRRSGLGQPERWSGRMDLQSDLQRQLYAARDPAHHGGRCAAVPRGSADL